MTTYDILQGNCLDVLKTLESESVQCCITSPPYWGLRDYGVDGQLGNEPTPEAFANALADVFDEVHRVLRKDGTLWMNLGDSYMSAPSEYMPKQTIGGDNQRDYIDNRDTDKGAPPNRTAIAGLKQKDLVGIPWLVAFELRKRGWWLRQDIIWAKPNPMPESVTDRCTKSHEYIFLLSKSKDYYYDHEAIQEPVAESSVARLKGNADGKFALSNLSHAGETPYANQHDMARNHKNLQSNGQVNHSFHESRAEGIPDEEYSVRNKRDVWTVTTKPLADAHFATFPEKLIEPCVLAGTKEGDLILDPFSGAATTGLVALKNHRNYIGIELNEKYIDISKRRLAAIQPKLFT